MATFVRRVLQGVIASGYKPLLFALFHIMSDDVQLPRPSWVSYEPQVMHARKKFFRVETSEYGYHTLTDSRTPRLFACS